MRAQLLVVDDEPSIVEMLVSYFVRHGLTADSAGSLREAQERLKGGGYLLVILDIMLAGESGLSLLGTLKRDHPGIKVLMFTGLGYDADLMSHAMDKGAEGYITKGRPMEDLLIAVRRVIQESAPVCP